MTSSHSRCSSPAQHWRSGHCSAISARDRFAIAASGFVAFGILGFLAVLRLPLGSATIGALSAGIAVIAGLQVMSWLMQTARRTETADPRAGMPDWSRRKLLITGSAIGVAALAGGVVGRMFGARSSVAPPEANAQIPPASDLAAALPPGTDLSPQVAGLTPIVVPNDFFYQIDTALLTPIVDSATWQLRIHGMVDRETTLTWDELLALPLFEQYVTIACVSNEIGGKLVGNAKWTGVRLREVLDLAGVQAGRRSTRRPVGRRLDRGHAHGLGHGPRPRADDRGAHERRPAATAARVPGPADRSRVVRLCVGDQVAGRARAHDLRCVQRLLGAARLGAEGADPHAVTDRHAERRFGRAPAASRSRAWPGRRIAASRKVEVGIDGQWQEARLSSPISDATWVQWVYDWNSTPGSHHIEVRATDGNGEVQTDQRTAPAPDGARGWHSVDVTRRISPTRESV